MIARFSMEPGLWGSKERGATYCLPVPGWLGWQRAVVCMLRDYRVFSIFG